MDTHEYLEAERRAYATWKAGRIPRTVGQRVTCNGYPGTISRVCEWSGGMVEVRLHRHGKCDTVCVDVAELRPR